MTVKEFLAWWCGSVACSVLIGAIGGWLSMAWVAVAVAGSFLGCAWVVAAAWRSETRAAHVELIAWDSARSRDEDWHTGRWLSPDGSQVMRVRWDPVIKVMFLDGVAWPRMDALARYVGALERQGWTPEATNATRAIRARLDLPGWETS